jgi:hypothetical protein
VKTLQAYKTQNLININNSKHNLIKKSTLLTDKKHLINTDQNNTLRISLNSRNKQKVLGSKI